jgi:hypothetical protein
MASFYNESVEEGRADGCEGHKELGGTDLNVPAPSTLYTTKREMDIKPKGQGQHVKRNADNAILASLLLGYYETEKPFRKLFDDFAEDFDCDGASKGEYGEEWVDFSPFLTQAYGADRKLILLEEMRRWFTILEASMTGLGT